MVVPVLLQVIAVEGRSREKEPCSRANAGHSGGFMDENCANNQSRKLCASWVCYVAGHKGVDRMLKQTPEQINEFWKEVARQIFAVHSGQTAKV
jgi:hypothetical protein